MAPFRNPDDTGPSSHTSEDLDSSGQNLVRKLNSLRMTDKRYIFDETRESYIDVMEGVSNLDIRYDLDVGSNQITVEVEEEGFETTFKSEEISSGSKEILALLTQIHLAREDTDLLAIEEPELHLHPEAERKVYRMIEELVEDYDTQVILSTHSDVFVNQSEPEGIIRVERDRTTEVRSVEQGEIQEELADLGYSKSGLLQSDAVVFVEGLSDKLILSEWAATLGLNVAEEGITVVELEGEGNVGTHGRSLVKLVYSFDIPYLFIVDSDDEDPEDVITQHKRKINREDDDVDEDRIWWYTTPDHFHAWSDSDIEYFLLQAPAAIADIVDEDEETIRDLIENTDADDNIDVLEAIWEECYTDPNGITSYQKGIHGKMIAKQMDETQIDEEVKTVIDEVRGLL